MLEHSVCTDYTCRLCSVVIILATSLRKLVPYNASSDDVDWVFGMPSKHQFKVKGETPVDVCSGHKVQKVGIYHFVGSVTKNLVRGENRSGRTNFGDRKWSGRTEDTMTPKFIRLIQNWSGRNKYLVHVEINLFLCENGLFK